MLIMIGILFVAELFLRTKATPIFACSGDNVRLFRNITINRQGIVVSLYSHENRLIGLWTSQKTTISDGYTKKVLLDKSGDIWILKLHPSDEAKYVISYGTTKYKKKLNVLVAPTANCTPTITRVDDVLIASLKADDCGKPTPSVYWLDYHGINNKGKRLIKLPPENKAGTYYACIEGPALRCASIAKLSECCSAFEINDIASEPSLAKLILVLAIVVSIGFVLASVPNTYAMFKIWQHKKVSFPKTPCTSVPV